MFRKNYKNSTLTSNQNGSAHGFFAISFAILVFAIIGTFHSVVSHASGDIPIVRSGYSGYCLDDKNSDIKPGAVVDLYGCNDTTAQAWSVGMDNIKHEGLCLSASGTHSGDSVLLNTCDSSPSEIWLRDGSGIYNPASRLCLDAPAKDSGTQLDISSCSSLNKPGETWISNQPLPGCGGVSQKGERIACNAEAEWVIWQSGKTVHNTLLTKYTDGASYEAWCADFVSYVYKESGYPFTGGEANGWDESNANNIQNMGFSMHDPGSYTPRPGDVAYFDYDGGHVEIVISGGKTPTFIYGNSATVDPATGNGQMAANTITKDGSLGKLIYYLSPN